MTDQQNPGGSGPDSSVWVTIGVVLIAAGALMAARNLGIVSWPLQQVWDFIDKSRGGLGVLAVGVLVIWWARSGKSLPAPQPGQRLYRSRNDKWLAGVLGGLGRYFGIDPTILRLAFLALVILFDLGVLIVPYIIMAILVPLEPVAPPAEPAA